MSNDLHGAIGSGWIGVDLDGTLAEYHGRQGPTHIGRPIPLMMKRVRNWLKAGIEVRIVTARVSSGKDDAVECEQAIRAWLEKHGLDPGLRITHEKDYEMLELWDDRVKQVIPNTGIGVEDELRRFVRVAELIGSIFYHGDFKAETSNEMELERELRALGYFFESEAELIAKLYPEAEE
jgi:hypothetical protein